jgi:hypothetical protein
MQHFYYITLLNLDNLEEIVICNARQLKNLLLNLRKDYHFKKIEVIKQPIHFDIDAFIYKDTDLECGEVADKN